MAKISWRQSPQSKKEACTIISKDSPDVIQMYKSKSCDTSLLPGKYVAQFDYKGQKVTVSQEITNFGRISRSAYVLDELIESGSANYMTEGKFMTFFSVDGGHALFPEEGQAFQVDKTGCRFLGHQAVYSFKRVTDLKE